LRRHNSLFVWGGVGLWFILHFHIEPLLAQSEQPRTPFLNRFQVNFGMGPNLLFGDLGGTEGNASRKLRDIDMLSIRGGLQVGARYKFNRWISAKVFLDGGVLSGNDRYSYNLANKARDLSVEAPFLMPGVQGEFYFLPDQSIPRRGTKAEVLPKAISPWSAYGILGFSGVRSFPFFKQGQAAESSGHIISPALLVAVGAEYWWHLRWSLSLEAGYVYAFTDFLDGVSARGNPAEPDGYYFLKVIFNRRFSSAKAPDAGVHCPDFTRGKAPSKKVQESKRLKFGKEYDKKKGSLNVKEYGQ
jgi:hypothetical protein